MQNYLHQFLHKHLIEKKKHLRFIAVLLVLSVVVATDVFWSLRQTGLALAGTAHCGITEHSHSSECNNTCGLQEHVHQITCYSDENADVESKADWELSLCGVPYSDNFSDDLLAIAKTQIGYQESINNFTVDENQEKNGYTRYGDWYGSPYGKWNAVFVSFCLYYAGASIGSIPMSSGPDAMMNEWKKTNLFHSFGSGAPKVGNLIFLNTDSDDSAEQVGIISSITDNEYKVIQGDNNNSVEEVSYSTDSIPAIAFVSSEGITEYLLNSGNERVQRAISIVPFMSMAPQSLTSGSQIIKYGGSNVAEDGTKVSKVISGTEIENIFDITLTVETKQKIETVYKEPDMAVVIVMDISNTMNTQFGTTNRYEAAMDAAEDFILHFAETAGDVSQIGYVAFNTDAHKIFDLQNCNNLTQANNIISDMRAKTEGIIYSQNYASSNKRYTNIEAGLQLGWDMIKNSTQEHKYIIFLSDGFPTTYLNNTTNAAYDGYTPVSSNGTAGNDGVFYDSVLKLYNIYGNSYSDKGAIKARKMATSIKNAGGTIFSIGVDIGGQTIQTYITQSEKAAASTDKFSVVDRTGKTYELGSATDPKAFKNWLGNSIGSGYYYDSNDAEGLKDAYESIFNEIQHLRHEESKAEWIACDPLPITEDEHFRSVEFIGFYDINNNLISISSSVQLTGEHAEGKENTALFLSDAEQINWDLKNSGFVTSQSGNVTNYKYELVYRVRLRNEHKFFEEHAEYNTNDVTTLTYRMIDTINGHSTISENRTLEFPIPSVKGYLGEFTFTKVDPHGGVVAGAEFTLSHDNEKCKICHGDGTYVTTVPDYIAVSDNSGVVTFSAIPSGHIYKMTESGIPSGYLDSGRHYWTTVSYDETTVNVASASGTAIEWDGTVLNLLPYDLPATGGSGTTLYTIVGTTLIAASAVLIYYRKRKTYRKT